MKATGHPTYYPEAKVTCACGNTFTVGSTKPEIYVEICAKCHPFFTGEMRFIDTQGRVKKFQNKQEAAGKLGYVKKRDRKRMLEKKEQDKEQKTPKTLKEMLQQAR